MIRTSLRRIALLGICSLVCSLMVVELASAAPKSGHPYYLALGDSLARGAQPNATGTTVPTNHGYSNDLYARMRRTNKSLKLEELGCLHESTATMIHGGICTYPGGSQLAAAVKFIKRHNIALITLDIGANDVDACVKFSGTQLASCVGNGINSITQNLPTIVKALRKAAGRKVEIIGMTYYDPYLADYFGNSTQQGIAKASVPLARSLNKTLAKDYKARRFKVADVAKAFHTYAPWKKKVKLAGHGKVPLAVAEICRLTWECAPPPRGPNIHAKKNGYKEIAAVFAAKL